MEVCSAVVKILVTGGAGYIGSNVVSDLLLKGHIVDGLDTRPASGVAHCVPYDTFAAEDYDTIIHFAAHSSVGACASDPSGALDNNLLNLAKFVRALHPEQAFIFASTGSLFDRNTSNLYDATKRAAETCITHLHPNSHILRFGTVCGVSSSMRDDLLLNGMVRAAVQRREITVWNPGAWRPVLFFSDLCYAVARCVVGLEPLGRHDLASFQARIGSWADMVARRLGVPIVDAGMSAHYSFRMDVVERSFVTPESVIDELAEYWRDRA